jgi:hypothetical protein
MNKYSPLFIFIFIISHAGSNPLPKKTVVSVLDTDNSYELRATYDEEKSEALKEALDNSVRPDKLFGQSISRFDAYIVLNDGTRFYFKYSDTRLVIKFNKKANSAAAFERMKTIFAAAKSVLNKNNE